MSKEYTIYCDESETRGRKYSNFYGGVIVLYADRLPMSVPDARKFKDLVFRLAGRSEFRNRGIRIAQEDVVEVVSHDHDLLQCLDIVLGAMNFRLNRKHKDKPEGQAWRSAKTRAKEKVYKAINKRIQELYPRFNIGITTGVDGDKANRWHHRYRHWCFTTRSTWR